MQVRHCDAYNKVMTKTISSLRLEFTANDVLHVMGATRMADFLKLVEERTIGGRERDKGELAERWRKAAAVFEALQTAEAGQADEVSVLPLSSTLQAHVDKLIATQYFQDAFAVVPVAFGMVELEKLIVYQQSIQGATVKKMTEGQSVAMSDQELADLCLPLSQPPASIRLVNEKNGHFHFVSDSHDARFQGAQLVKPADVKGLKINGQSQAIVALSFGFSTNVLNVVRYGKRMVLNNGYHRAFALSRMGIKYAPCLIQVCGHWEDVGMAGSSEISNNGELFFSKPRPPLLKDYSNSELTAIFPVKQATKEIRLNYEIASSYLYL